MSRPQKQTENIWSRRRAAVLAEAEADTKTAERADAAVKQAAMAEKSDADILLELNLKDPDQMQQGDDFTSFMLAEVPERLRKRALRTLWRSNPVLACVDDLLDYGDDFKAEWDGADLIKTVYRVGKGMLKDEDLAPPTPETPVDPEEVAMASAPPAPEPDNQRPIAADEAPAQQVDPETEPAPIQSSPRRMRFEFDEVT